MLPTEYRIASRGYSPLSLFPRHGRVYSCTLFNEQNHQKIEFSLIIEGDDESAHFMKQYKAINQHINVGDLFLCKFAWEPYELNSLQLCISGFCKRNESILSPKGKDIWIKPPGLIPCTGDGTTMKINPVLQNHKPKKSFKNVVF